MVEPLAAVKLEMLKGPREGETLEYRPRSKVRIGRVVRGNNLAIKDSGISTNHLIIHSDSESGAMDDPRPRLLQRNRRQRHQAQAGHAAGAELENSELEREGEEIEAVEKPKRGRPRGVLKSEDLVEEVAVVPDSETCSEQVKIEPKRRGGGRKRKNVPLMCEKDNVVVGESGNDSENSSHEEAATDCNVAVGGDEPDLEKMTLDDWFYYVQVSLPKGVNDEIDKICAGMRHKAKLVHEYIAQHNKESQLTEGVPCVMWISCMSQEGNLHLILNKSQYMANFTKGTLQSIGSLSSLN